MNQEKQRGNQFLIGILGIAVILGTIYLASSRLQRDMPQFVEDNGALFQQDETVEGASARIVDVVQVTESDTASADAGAEAADDSQTEEGAAESAAAEGGDSGAAIAQQGSESSASTSFSTPGAAGEQTSRTAGIADAPQAIAAFNKGGCAGCHVIPGIPGANGQIGPDLSQIGSTAHERKEGMEAEAYIRESILEPNAFIAPSCPLGDCPSGVMLQSFAQTLSDQDLNAILGYLLTLGTDQMPAMVSATEQQRENIEIALPPESVNPTFAELPSGLADNTELVLGKHLFFDSRLSGNNSLSCASCHQPDRAFTDGADLSRGYPSTSYFRNTPTLLNTAFADRLYWDGRMDGRDMATLVRDHIAESHFMSMDGRLMVERLNQIPAYVDLFEQAYGGTPGYGSVLNAIAAYVRSLNSPATPFDRFASGDGSAISGEAQAGFELFNGKAGCATCHSGPLFSDGEFHNVGVDSSLDLFADPERSVTFRRFFRILGTPNYRNLDADVGLYALTIQEDDRGKFRTPSLREVSRTAPYMHTGSLATLADVVRFYNDGAGASQTAELAPLGLSDPEIEQIVAFLETLGSEPIPVTEPALPNYELLTLGSSGD